MDPLRAVLVAVVVVLAAHPTMASASCIQEPLADRATRAEIVVYGRVVGTEGAPVGGAPARYAIVRVERVLKGSAVEQIGVALGPGGGGPGAPVATSVDHVARQGEDHTLFIRRDPDGRLETDACSGSHPGPPTADETAMFGAGGPPAPGEAATRGWSLAEPSVAVAVVLLALTTAAAAFFAFRALRGVAR